MTWVHTLPDLLPVQNRYQNLVWDVARCWQEGHPGCSVDCKRLEDEVFLVRQDSHLKCWGMYWVVGVVVPLQR